VNLVTLLIGLSMAWERPQRRGEERIGRGFDCRVEAQGVQFSTVTDDLSLSGLSFLTTSADPIPGEFDVILQGRTPMTCRARVLYHEILPGKRIRCGAEFLDLQAAQRQWLVINLFGDPATWERAHDARVRSPLLMAGHLFAGFWRSLKAPLSRRRRIPRRGCLVPVRIQIGHARQWGVVRDRSSHGMGVLLFGRPAESAAPWLMGEGRERCEPLYVRRRWLWIWRAGVRPADLFDHSISHK
jgi:hypothetical protein